MSNPSRDMSCLEHLEELRWHIIRSTISVLLVAIVAFLAKDIIFDQIIFAVAINSEKNPLFNSDERIELILGATKHIPNVKAYSTDGLIADFARDHNAVALIRGLRHVSDFEFEFQMATMNHHLNENVSTLLMVTSEHYIHLNSSVVKDVAKLNGDISKFVSSNVMLKLKEKFDRS